MRREVVLGRRMRFENLLCTFYGSRPVIRQADAQSLLPCNDMSSLDGLRASLRGDNIRQVPSYSSVGLKNSLSHMKHIRCSYRISSQGIV
jgi:hypothetical protein